MKKTIVVSDTNIFIDLVKLNLLGDFFALPWDIHTTDFVINELTDYEQRIAVTAFIKRKKLTVGKLNADEIGDIVRRSNETGGKISITDFSVCLYSKKNNFILLTGDGNLRKVASNDNIEVHGILYLFDELVSYSILPPQTGRRNSKSIEKNQYSTSNIRCGCSNSTLGINQLKRKKIFAKSPKVEIQKEPTIEYQIVSS